LAGRLGFEPR